MPASPPRDNRGFFMIPLGYEGGGYYAYGEPGGGTSQYAHPKMISLLLRIASAWNQLDSRKFGVGDISRADGPDHPHHATHQNGLEVDIRPIRKDGVRDKCWISKSQYDREATAKLIALFTADPTVKLVYFNDPKIPGVRYCRGHDNHFHVALRGD